MDYLYPHNEEFIYQNDASQHPMQQPYYQGMNYQDARATTPGFELQPGPVTPVSQPGFPFGGSNSPFSPFLPGGGGFPGGPSQGAGPSQVGPPSTPPPSQIPAAFSSQGAGGPSVLAVDPGSIRGCLFRFTFIRLSRFQQFWFYPTFVGRTSVAGYRWTGFNWVYFGIDLNRIESFTCV
ncbi:hypothetical protein GGQ92_001480 [Gracilibacillus halotolerans]|uniref:Transporter n=1 Tax=Gracilibacillus halotolerans TaxID=74386 RepID=A0A841RP31_9BACI|nr:hypothetical protein [Gracilibacillus halotolerans]MBB6512694.1 hypothetical protein [Gracilibacillus halotolerans]